MKIAKSILLFLSITLSAHAVEEEFPNRRYYPEVRVIETADLNLRLPELQVVDVRSRYEFETLHVNGAINVPLIAAQDFEDKIRTVSERTRKPLVFYCNGRACVKSYQAARRAIFAKVDDVYAYDAGIMDWAKAHPEQTTLLYKTPIKASDLITQEQFSRRLLDPKAFGARVGAGDKVVVLDVRDVVQRDSPLFPFVEKRAALDQKRKIDEVIALARREKKPLLIYDKTGQQVQWFQYYLVNKDVKEYYFLRGGAEAYFEATLGKVSLDNGK